MILGIDHVVLTVYNLDKALQDWKMLGFKSRFIEYELATHPSKKDILDNFEPQHGIALVQGDYGIAIELVTHGQSMTKGVSPYCILLDTWTLFEEYSFPIIPIENWLTSQPLSTGYGSVWCQTGKDKTGLRCMILYTTNLSESVEFWTKALHFTIQDTTNEWIKLTFRSVIPTWSLDIILVESSTPYHTLLDSPGVTCISIVTDRIEQDMKQLRAYDAQQVSDIFSLVVNNRLLSVVFFRSPTNELIEMITLK